MILKVSNIDKQINVLKTNILSSMARLDNNGAEPNTQPDEATERYLKAKIIRYQRAQNAAIINSGNFRIVKKPEDDVTEMAPNVFFVYVLALLFGLLIPRLFTLINSRNALTVHRGWFNRQTFGDMLKILFEVSK